MATISKEKPNHSTVKRREKKFCIINVLIDHAEKQNIQVTLLTQPVAYPVDGASK